MSNSIKDSVQAFAVNQVLKYVDSNPQEAFPKLLDWADILISLLKNNTTLIYFIDKNDCWYLHFP